MAALFGALPLALGRGTGSEFRRPLGIAVAGGLILSQILTLYTTPVIYLLLDRLRLRFQRHATLLRSPVTRAQSNEESYTAFPYALSEQENQRPMPSGSMLQYCFAVTVECWDAMLVQSTYVR